MVRRAVAELVGTAFLLAAIVGSGITAERLAGGNVATALLANTVATGAALVALILTFGPIGTAGLSPCADQWRFPRRGRRTCSATASSPPLFMLALVLRSCSVNSWQHLDS